jgi:hypothetical protein
VDTGQLLKRLLQFGLSTCNNSGIATIVINLIEAASLTIYLDNVLKVVVLMLTIRQLSAMPRGTFEMRPLYGDEISGRIALQCKTATQHRVDFFLKKKKKTKEKD